MKIIISADYDLYFAFIINKFLPYLLKHDVKIIISHESGKGYGIKELEFFEHNVLKKSIFPFLERHNIQSKFLTFKQIEQKYNIEFIDIENINNPNGIKILEDFQPDVLFSIRNRVIFKEKVISIPKKGIINIHPAKLPNYRGLLTMLRMFNNREDFGACSIHYISDLTIDTGDIIEIVEVPLYKTKSIVWNLLNSYEKGTDGLIRTLKKLENNETIKATKQKKLKGNYYSYPTRDEINKFSNDGYGFLMPDDCIEILNRMLDLFTIYI